MHSRLTSFQYMFPLGIKPTNSYLDVTSTYAQEYAKIIFLLGRWREHSPLRVEMDETRGSGSHEPTDEWKPLIQQGVLFCKLRKCPLQWTPSGGCDEETKLCETLRGSSLSGGTKPGLWEVWEASSKTWGWPVGGTCEGSFVSGSVWEKLTFRVAVGPQSILSLRRMECAGGMELYKCPLCSDNHLTFSSCFVKQPQLDLMFELKQVFILDSKTFDYQEQGWQGKQTQYWQECHFFSFLLLLFFPLVIHWVLMFNRHLVSKLSLLKPPPPPFWCKILLHRAAYNIK